MYAEHVCCAKPPGFRSLHHGYYHAATVEYSLRVVFVIADKLVEIVESFVKTLIHVTLQRKQVTCLHLPVEGQKTAVRLVTAVPESRRGKQSTVVTRTAHKQVTGKLVQFFAKFGRQMTAFRFGKQFFDVFVRAVIQPDKRTVEKFRMHGGVFLEHFFKAVAHRGKFKFKLGKFFVTRSDKGFDDNQHLLRVVDKQSVGFGAHCSAKG